MRSHNLENERIKLAKIVKNYNLQKETLNNLFSKLNEIKENFQEYMQKNNFDAVIISNCNQYILKLNQEIISAKELLVKIEKETIQQQNNVKQAYIQEQTLVKLKEKQFEAYKKQMLQEENKIIDDIVNTRKAIKVQG